MLLKLRLDRLSQLGGGRRRLKNWFDGLNRLDGETHLIALRQQQCRALERELRSTMTLRFVVPLHDHAPFNLLVDSKITVHSLLEEVARGELTMVVQGMGYIVKD
jgi:hypothetical protein